MSSIIFQKYDKIFSNVCSIKIDLVNYSICSISTITTEKWRNTVTLWWGVAKTKNTRLFCSVPNSRFIYTPTIKFYLLLIIRNPIKIRQICHSDKNYPLSYPISLKPTKINPFTHFTTKKSNSHIIKNSPIISKLSLFISTFTDNHFPSKKL